MFIIEYPNGKIGSSEWEKRAHINWPNLWLVLFRWSWNRELDMGKYWDWIQNIKFAAIQSLSLESQCYVRNTGEHNMIWAWRIVYCIRHTTTNTNAYPGISQNRVCGPHFFFLAGKIALQSGKKSRRYFFLCIYSCIFCIRQNQIFFVVAFIVALVLFCFVCVLLSTGTLISGFLL